MLALRLRALAGWGATVLFLSVTAASAATVACNTLIPDATGNLTPNAGCQAFEDTSDPDPADFDGLFGYDDWVELAKIDANDIDGNSSDGGFTFTSTDGNKTGTWSVTGYTGPLVIVLKDGNQAPAPTLLYLLDGTSGTWSSPWVNSNTGESVASLSNVQLWGLEVRPPPIPVPAAGILLVTALGGLGFLARRKATA
jgi:hypothetical protein